MVVRVCLVALYGAAGLSRSCRLLLASISSNHCVGSLLPSPVLTTARRRISVVMELRLDNEARGASSTIEHFSLGLAAIRLLARAMSEPD